MYTVNTELSFEEAGEIALEFNCIAEEEEKVDIVEEALRDTEDPEDSLVTRPPVVCVMGHVDHGKTSLLDAIRHSSVTEGEAGGITQHIGAYTVKANDKIITFLDTPGHEAFTAMRLRGAKSTDIAILVVAADDGVMPQTVEAINHAKAAGIQIIVAVNKIDKPSANIERVKQELTEHGLIAEDWGGETIFCPVSAHTHEGLDNLLDMILLTSEMLELKSNPNRKARGVVIEARLDKGRGPVATLLVQKGTLKVGDFIAIGEANGRVRAMNNDKGKPVKEATPSMPVEIIGLSSVPNSGDTFISTETEKEARQISEAFITRGKENLIAESKKQMSLDDIFTKMQEGTLKELNIIIKADVQGSVEALKQSLLKLSNEEVIIKCIHSGVGAINESDVVLASASSAIIIGFNIRPDAQAKALSEQEKVDIRLYNVIYNAIDDIESAMKGMLDPIYEEKVLGHAEIRSTFKASGVGTIAGCFILDGLVERNCMVRISRDEEQIFEGKLSSLKRFKDDVKEVKNGYECGMVFDNWNDLREGDRIEAYKMVEVERK
jgi:translation initiation factor IF-2